MYKQTKFKTMWARIRYFISLIIVKIRKKDTPVICTLVVNNKCNFNCRYCFGSYSKRNIPDYTTKELKKLIDELYDMGTRYLNIHGGETLLRKDIGEIVDYIKNKGIYCCLITNGSLLPKKIDEIRNVDNITVSLDGCKENNDKNRGKGSFDKALKAIKLAVKEKIPLRVSATITKYTMDDIGYLAKLAKDIGFTVHFSILFKPLNEAKDYEMTSEEIRSSVNQIIEYKKKGYPVFTSYKAAKYARDWPSDHNEYHFISKKESYRLPSDFQPIKCYYGNLKIIIEGDGNLYPCFLLGDPSKFKSLNWKEVGIEKAIEHLRKTKPCLTCPTMTNNDHSLLLGLDIKQIIMLFIDQFKESLRRK